jgi:EAL domain-containing protein (putative c-di-GMP-specific phosphodiesterase class I)
VDGDSGVEPGGPPTPADRAPVDATRSLAFDVEPLMLAGEAGLEYQPLVDLGSGRLLGFEALLRWHHPTEGRILPRLLIPWLEANGDIVRVGEWVLAEACRHASAWPNNVQLAVNCSLIQLRRGVASKAILQALDGAGLDPSRLTIEVTEHAMSDDAAVNDLIAITRLGVELAVDDVGTSWTSFDLLRRMAVNTVKIDRSFVNGLEADHGINRMVVETVVHLAHSSGMSAVAEGVETELQARIVREFDCDAAQGYFFAPPMGVGSATDMAASADLRFQVQEPDSAGTPPPDRIP